MDKVVGVDTETETHEEGWNVPTCSLALLWIYWYSQHCPRFYSGIRPHQNTIESLSAPNTSLSQRKLVPFGNNITATQPRFLSSIYNLCRHFFHISFSGGSFISAGEFTWHPISSFMFKVLPNFGSFSTLVSCFELNHCGYKFGVISC